MVTERLVTVHRIRQRIEALTEVGGWEADSIRAQTGLAAVASQPGRTAEA